VQPIYNLLNAESHRLLLSVNSSLLNVYHCCCCIRVCLQDLEKLLSVFTAKPWQRGWQGFFTFVFRTRARGWSPRQSSSQVPEARGDAESSGSSRSSCAPDALAEVRIVMPASPVGQKAVVDKAATDTAPQS
jgi:hypothetical protein